MAAGVQPWKCTEPCSGCIWRGQRSCQYLQWIPLGSLEPLDAEVWMLTAYCTYGAMLRGSFSFHAVHLWGMLLNGNIDTQPSPNPAWLLAQVVLFLA